MKERFCSFCKQKRAVVFDRGARVKDERLLCRRCLSEHDAWELSVPVDPELQWAVVTFGEYPGGNPCLEEYFSNREEALAYRRKRAKECAYAMLYKLHISLRLEVAPEHPTFRPTETAKRKRNK